MWNLVTTAAALLILIPMLGNVTRHAGETTADAAVCHQLATTAALRDAAVAYVIANHASLGIGAGATASLAPSTLIAAGQLPTRSEEHTSELQSLMRISYAVFCLKKKKTTTI